MNANDIRKRLEINEIPFPEKLPDKLPRGFLVLSVKSVCGEGAVAHHAFRQHGSVFIRQLGQVNPRVVH